MFNNVVELTSEEILAQAIVFLTAGSETSAPVLAFFLHALAVNPTIQDKLVNEIEEIVGDKVYLSK